MSAGFKLAVVHKVRKLGVFCRMWLEAASFCVRLGAFTPFVEGASLKGSELMSFM